MSQLRKSARSKVKQMGIIDMFPSEEETIEQANRISDMLSLCRQTAEHNPYNVYEGVMTLSDTNNCKFFCLQDFKTIREIMNSNPSVIRMWNHRPTLEALYSIADKSETKNTIRKYMAELGLLADSVVDSSPFAVVALEN